MHFWLHIKVINILGQFKQKDIFLNYLWNVSLRFFRTL
jgi:hypothetical protein